MKPDFLDEALAAQPQSTKSTIVASKDDTCNESKGAYAIEFFLGQMTDRDKYIQYLEDLFESVSAIDNYHWHDYKDARVIVLDIISKNGRTWSRIATNIDNLFSKLGEDEFVRIRVYKDVHFKDGEYCTRTRVFDDFLTIDRAFPINVFADIFHKI